MFNALQSAREDLKRESLVLVEGAETATTRSDTRSEGLSGGNGYIKEGGFKIKLITKQSPSRCLEEDNNSEAIDFSIRSVI